MHTALYSLNAIVYGIALPGTNAIASTRAPVASVPSCGLLSQIVVDFSTSVVVTAVSLTGLASAILRSARSSSCHSGAFWMVSQLGKGFSALQVHFPSDNLAALGDFASSLRNLCISCTFTVRTGDHWYHWDRNSLTSWVRGGGGQQRSRQTLPPHKHTSRRMDERVVRVKVQHLPQAVPLQQSGLGM